MAEKENMTLDFVTPEWQEKTPTADGGARQRIPYGDYKMKIISVEMKMKEGDAQPRRNSFVTFQVTKAYQEANKGAVDMQISAYYAGSAESAPFMHKRLTNLLKALNYRASKGKPFAWDHVIGQECDATVTWQLSNTTIDRQTGEERRYVNDRIQFERPVNSPHPPVNAEMDSRAAVAYLKQQGGEAPAEETDMSDAAAPWQQPPVSEGAAAPVMTGTPPPATFKPEGEAPDLVYSYRAHIAMKSQHADEARAGLLNAGFDPEGPVVIERLDAETKALYTAWQAKQKPASGGLPPLGGNSGAKKAGTRSPKAPFAGA